MERDGMEWKDLGVGGWGPEIPFFERIEKPVRKNGPPLITSEKV